MTGKLTLLATLLVALTLAGMPASASTSSPEASAATVAAAPGAAAAVEAELSRQQQSAWLGSLLLSFLAMIGSVCLASAWAAWLYHRSVASSIRCGAAARRSIRIPAPVRATLAAPTVASPGVRSAPVQLPPVRSVELDELFALVAGRRPAPRSSGEQLLEWSRALAVSGGAGAAHLGACALKAVNRSFAGTRRVLHWNGWTFSADTPPSIRRVLHWNSQTFVTVPENAQRRNRPAVAANELRLAS